MISQLNNKILKQCNNRLGLFDMGKYTFSADSIKLIIKILQLLMFIKIHNSVIF